MTGLFTVGGTDGLPAEPAEGEAELLGLAVAAPVPPGDQRLAFQGTKLIVGVRAELHLLRSDVRGQLVAAAVLPASQRRPPVDVDGAEGGPDRRRDADVQAQRHHPSEDGVGVDAAPLLDGKPEVGLSVLVHQVGHRREADERPETEQGVAHALRGPHLEDGVRDAQEPRTVEGLQAAGGDHEDRHEHVVAELHGSLDVVGERAVHVDHDLS